ncbi:MAG: hypothetical protein ACP5DZ_05145 [Bacteroidales bacterium]
MKNCYTGCTPSNPANWKTFFKTKKQIYDGLKKVEKIPDKQDSMKGTFPGA